MKIKIKLKSLIFVLLILFFAGGGFILAQGLEVKYPTIPGAPLPEKPALPEYVRYLYNFSIIIAGLVAFFSLVYGGFRYLTSAGHPAAMADARLQITAGILGLLILLGSYIFLTIVNPQLTILQLGKLSPPTVVQKCGNNICEGGEDSESCPEDCPKGPEVSFAHAIEVPVGTLIEKVLEESRLNRIKALAKEAAEKYAKKVEEAARALVEELANCSCSKTNPNFAVCDPGGSCPLGLACTGEPCNRDRINQLRGELRNAYLDFEGWLAGGALYSELASLKKDAVKLYIAKVLLEEGLMPLNYDNFLEIKQTILEAGGQVQVDSLAIGGEIIKGEQDSANFYFDADMNEDLFNDLLSSLGADIGMWDVISKKGWRGTIFPISPGQQILIWPTKGCITQWYDTRNLNIPVYAGGCHRAIDISAPRGTPVIAARDGKVYKIVNNCQVGDTKCGDTFGNYVALEHQSSGVTFYTLYGHLDYEKGIPVSIGQEVKQGDVIGYVNDTGWSLGDHLDFRLMTGSAPLGVTYDPLPYLPPLPTPEVGICELCGENCHDPACTSIQPPFACKFGTGPCSVDNLKPVFGEYAGAASMICQAESGGNPFTLNDNCLAGISCDYSIGLFQINLLFQSTPSINCPAAFTKSCPNCSITNQSAVNQCVTYFEDADNNIKKAYEIFVSWGFNWGAWENSAIKCGLPY